MVEMDAHKLEGAAVGAAVCGQRHVHEQQPLVLAAERHAVIERETAYQHDVAGHTHVAEAEARRQLGPARRLPCERAGLLQHNNVEA